LDEDPSASAGDEAQFRTRLAEIIQASKGFRRVVITSRSAFFLGRIASKIRTNGQVVIGKNLCEVLKLQPFGRKERKLYLKRRFAMRCGRREMVVSQRWAALRLLAGLPKEYGTAIRPLVLFSICELAGADGERGINDGDSPDRMPPINLYDVYESVVEEWLLHEVRKQGVARSRSGSRFERRSV
jgi:hypothetical protein